MADKQNDYDVENHKVEGYRESRILEAASWIAIILSLGLLRFIFYLRPVWFLKATHSKTSLSSAQKLLVTEYYEKKRTQFICDVKIIDLTCIRLSFQNQGFKDMNESNRFIDEQFEAIFENDTLVYFTDGSFQVLGDTLQLCFIKKLPYLWNKEYQEFKRLAGIGPGLTHQDIHHFNHSNLQRHIMRKAYGDNVLEVPDSPFLVIALKETFTPFYLLQFVNSILWGVTGDWTYAGIMFAFTFLIIFLSSAQTKWNQKKLKESVSSNEIHIQLVSENELLPISSYQLLPGDRIVLPGKASKIPCDGILLSGSAIVNESMLTGESFPQSKTALPSSDLEFLEKERGSHLLYSGTNILKTRSNEPLIMLVTRTGFLTSQGAIIRSLLYPRPLDYLFELSVVKFAIGLFSLSLIGAIIYDIIEITHKENPWKVILNTVKIAIMLIPAIMPIITASKLIGISRLIRRKIYCINSAAFNLAGSATCICFDKTGTLTEDGLDLQCVVPCQDRKLKEEYTQDPREDMSQLVRALASCHSLSVLDETIVGDPIDVKMFEWTQWIFNSAEKGGDNSLCTVSSPNNELSIEIIHECQFSSKLQRMSVIVQCSDELGQLRLYCKGAPETIASLCLPDSVPTNFTFTLESYTRKGYRVLAVGTKVLNEESYSNLQRTDRTTLEQQLTFLGMIVFQNKLKAQTIPSIQELKNADYEIKMITGDNQETADSVAVECGIIGPDQTIIELSEENGNVKCFISKPTNPVMADSAAGMESGAIEDTYIFSLSGKAWQILKEKHRDLIPKILIKAVVFARMTCDQKKEIVTELNALGYGVVMCGDGANDCGALRAANVGVSLSQSESCAAASFSSRIDDISCIPLVIKYGRCSLASSLYFFKYMMMSSIVMSIAESLLQSYNSDLSTGEHLYLNFISNTNIALWFSRSDAYLGPLPPHLPFTSVLSFPVLFSMAFNILIFYGFQLSAIHLLKIFPWYRSKLFYENYALFCAAALQLLVLAISQSPGYPFRQPIYRNYLLSIALTILIILGLIITLNTPATFINWFNFLFPPNIDFPLSLLALIICNFAVAMLIERLLVDKIIYKRCKRYPYLIKTKTREKYLNIQEELPSDYEWVLSALQLSTTNKVTTELEQG